MITGQTNVSFADYCRALAGHSLVARLLAGSMILMFVYFLAGALTSLFSDDLEDILGSWAYLVLVLVVWFGPLVWSYRRLSPQQRQITYEIDSERVVMRDAIGNAVIFPWAEARSCREVSEGFSLRMTVGRRWISKHAFGPEALRELRTEIRAHLGGQARLMD